MDAKIIEQMQKYLSKSYLCQGDFSHDKKCLDEYNEQFFWMVREHGTSLCCVGMSRMLAWKKSERSRFALFQDMNCAISNIMYWNEPAKYFYYDGIALVPIKKEDVPELWKTLFAPFYKEMLEDFREEYEICNKPLEIKWASEATQNNIKEALKFAESLNDPSLKNCIERLKNYNRFAVNQHIEIYNDFQRYSFGWAEMVNGSPVINGGIIYHEANDGNHWQIHT